MAKKVSNLFWVLFEILITCVFLIVVMPKEEKEELSFVVDNYDATKLIDFNSMVLVSDEVVSNVDLLEDKQEEVLEEKVVDNKEEKKQDEEVLIKDINEDEQEEKEVVLENTEEKTEIKEENNNNDDNLDSSDAYTVLETKNNMTITGYGYDCRGCSTGKTSSGYDITNTIYYEDSEFGQVRIVAADKSIPFYSIIRLSNIYNMDPVIAIVLDRGSSIGFDKPYQFDLVFENELVANQNIDPSKNREVVYELLRSGK